MAKFELKFIDSMCFDEFIKAEVDKGSGEALICISGKSEFDFTIFLDKSTAIKFAKTLRTEINKIIEREGKNG